MIADFIFPDYIYGFRIGFKARRKNLEIWKFAKLEMKNPILFLVKVNLICP
jgi:hypothetical protein